MTTATVNGREYKVEVAGTPERHPQLAADMQARGWDGYHYLLTGKRGSKFYAQRGAKTGEFVLMSRLGK